MPSMVEMLATALEHARLQTDGRDSCMKWEVARCVCVCMHRQRLKVVFLSLWSLTSPAPLAPSV